MDVDIGVVVIYDDDLATVGQLRQVLRVLPDEILKVVVALTLNCRILL